LGEAWEESLQSSSSGPVGSAAAGAVGFFFWVTATGCSLSTLRCM